MALIGGVALASGLGLGLGLLAQPQTGSDAPPAGRLLLQIALESSLRPAIHETGLSRPLLARADSFSVRRRAAGLHAASQHELATLEPDSVTESLPAKALASLALTAQPRETPRLQATAPTRAPGPPDAPGSEKSRLLREFGQPAENRPVLARGDNPLGDPFQSAAFRVAPLGGQIGDPAEIECLARNIYFESRGEGEAGRLAVGNVTMNRVLDPAFPSSVCGVVTQGGLGGKPGCQFSWWCDGRSDEPLDQAAWGESRATALRVYWDRSRDLTDGALWFHADYVSPTWASTFDKGPQIGRHLFYSRPLQSAPDGDLVQALVSAQEAGQTAPEEPRTRGAELLPIPAAPPAPPLETAAGEPLMPSPEGSVRPGAGVEGAHWAF